MIGLELGGNRELPQRQVLGHVRVHRLLGAFERAQIAAHDLGIEVIRNPPQRLEGILHDLAQAQLLGHRDLRRQQARGLDLTVDQRLEPRAEPARVHHFDILNGKVFFQPERYVEMAARAHADRHRYVLEILRMADRRIRAHEDRPWRDPIGVGHHLSHPRAGVADRAPQAGSLDDLALVLGIGPVLRPLEIVEVLPARLGAAKRLPVEINIEPLGGEESFLLSNEVVEPHAFRGDRHLLQAHCHGAVLPESIDGCCFSRPSRTDVSAIRTLAQCGSRPADLSHCPVSLRAGTLGHPAARGSAAFTQILRWPWYHSNLRPVRRTWTAWQACWHGAFCEVGSSGPTGEGHAATDFSAWGRQHHGRRAGAGFCLGQCPQAVQL